MGNGQTPGQPTPCLLIRGSIRDSIRDSKGKQHPFIVVETGLGTADTDKSLPGIDHRPLQVPFCLTKFSNQGSHSAQCQDKLPRYLGIHMGIPSKRLLPAPFSPTLPQTLGYQPSPPSPPPNHYPPPHPLISPPHPLPPPPSSCPRRPTPPTRPRRLHPLPITPRLPTTTPTTQLIPIITPTVLRPRRRRRVTIPNHSNPSGYDTPSPDSRERRRIPRRQQCRRRRRRRWQRAVGRWSEGCSSRGRRGRHQVWDLEGRVVRARGARGRAGRGGSLRRPWLWCRLGGWAESEGEGVGGRLRLGCLGLGSCCFGGGRDDDDFVAEGGLVGDGRSAAVAAEAAAVGACRGSAAEGGLWGDAWEVGGREAAKGAAVDAGFLFVAWDEFAGGG